ncbi:NupC/NupG family nucleoside CNT transporter [Bacillus sp. AGMB 02131]|uniref:NupC/NupG family nucleoside CNT transporter n=1 Tax=Peribacillus faecalis TaxID=2772559 RepID=A0A927HBZ1_9BACI|nr:nucleoside transporter C-terminal domain-containing protein [Peribacillus faecalis]MBD3109102.1 NupC/NupG family nucleoside CNT transporter [Peribacillus faecalis]
MFSIIIAIIGIALLLGVAFLLSNDKKNINFKAVGIMIGLQLLVSWLLLSTKAGLNVIAAVSRAFEKLLSYGYEGIDFVVGGWIPDGGSPFFVNVLLPVVFTAALLSLLTHLRILPYIIKYLGGLLSKITGLPQVESFNAINSVFFGQSEAILAIKSQIDHLNKNRLFIVSTSAMASVSAALIASYMTMLPAKYVLVGVILNMFSGLIVASIITPVKASKEDREIVIDDMIHTKNVFDAIGTGAIDGGKVTLIVGAMLIGYLGLLALLNGIFNGIFGMDLTTMIGYVFSPIAYLMGVPSSEILTSGSIMGTKLLSNEFVAILQLQPLLDVLSTKASAVLSTFLVSFANFSSIGIIAGAVQAINGAKAKEVSSFGLKLLLVATMASILSATVVGLFA